MNNSFTLIKLHQQIKAYEQTLVHSQIQHELEPFKILNKIFQENQGYQQTFHGKGVRDKAAIPNPGFLSAASESDMMREMLHIFDLYD